MNGTKVRKLGKKFLVKRKSNEQRKRSSIKTSTSGMFLSRRRFSTQRQCRTNAAGTEPVLG
jgi:hypothetical protein